MRRQRKKRKQLTLDGISDEVSALVLLAGYIDEDEKGLRRQFYLEDESRARAALVRLLLNYNQPFGQIRCRLAALFAPETSTDERQIVFKFRSGRGRRHQHLANTQIANDVLDRLLEANVIEEVPPAQMPGALKPIDAQKLAAAVGAVADKYGLDDKHVERQWRRYRSVHERWYRVGSSN